MSKTSSRHRRKELGENIVITEYENGHMDIVSSQIAPGWLELTPEACDELAQFLAARKQRDA